MHNKNKNKALVECFFDISSPWTWLAFRNLQRLSAELSVPIMWKPILVGGVFNAINPSMYEFRERGVPAKQAYMHKDLQDWATHEGVKIVFPPSVFPLNSVKVMRGCLWLLEQGLMEPFAALAFETYWSEDQDISNDSVLVDLCEKTDTNAEGFFTAIARQAIKDKLKANTEELIARGGFGSPTIFVNKTDMYFGNDRMGLVREAVKKMG
jgi:2-hydroxychromene-2-carboxylate isomerase